MPSLSKINAVKAKEKLIEYLVVHDLDTSIDWSNDPIHGPIIKPLLDVIELAQMKTVVKKRAKVTKARESAIKYPLVDGKPMTKRMRAYYKRAVMGYSKFHKVSKEEASQNILLRLEAKEHSSSNPYVSPNKKYKVDKREYEQPVLFNIQSDTREKIGPFVCEKKVDLKKVLGSKNKESRIDNFTRGAGKGFRRNSTT